MGGLETNQVLTDATEKRLPYQPEITGLNPDDAPAICGWALKSSTQLQ